MTKAETGADKRRQGYPAKKQKGKKFNHEHDRIFLENEIMKLENEKEELQSRLDEKSQLCAELNEAYQSEKAMRELDLKELAKVKKLIRTSRYMAAAGIIIGIIGIVLSFI